MDRIPACKFAAPTDRPLADVQTDGEGSEINYAGNNGNANNNDTNDNSTNSGITLTYEGVLIAYVAKDSSGASWAYLLPAYDNACGCCDLCSAQPAGSVSGGMVER